MLIPALIIVFVAVIFVEIELARRGPRLEFQNPSSAPITLGRGTPLTYAVMGDSTAAGEGASSPGTGIANMTAQFLAKNHAVTFVNLAMSGARTKDVLSLQTGKAAGYKPDVVLLSVGANDVTHVTPTRSVHTDLQAIVAKLIQANCNVKIVLTGAPDMGAIPRFAQPLRALAGLETNRLNGVFTQIVANDRLTFAPIAQKTGPEFRARPDLFAADNYHPNDAGYQLWLPVLEQALSQALVSQPAHCS